jgi:hypothetical protein
MRGHGPRVRDKLRNMYETQLLKIKIRPGMTEKVVQFIQSLKEREEACIEGLRREGMIVESLFLERGEEFDYLYYYVKSKDLAHAYEINMQSSDPLTCEIRKFISDTWGTIASPEPLLDLNVIPEAPRKARSAGKLARMADEKPATLISSSPHALAGG